MNRLYLVGTNHEDPKGVSRLEKIFDWTRPSMITVESDEERSTKAVVLHDGYEHRRQQLDWLLTQSFGRERADYVLQVLEAASFDQWMPTVYGRKHHVPVRLIDDIRHIEEQANNLWRARYEQRFGSVDDLGEAFMEYLTTCDPDAEQAKYDAGYDRTAVHAESDIGLFYGICARRETNMEEQIRKAVTATEGNVLHIGGNMHLFGEHYNLYDRLKDLQPVRIKLRDADSF